MGEQHGLRGLDVGRPGQDRGALTLGQADERPLEVEQRPVQPIDRAPEPEPQVGRDLVVARAPGVQLSGHGADAVGQGRFEVEVDVLERGVPIDRAGGDRLGEPVQATDELIDLVVGQQAGACQPADVRDRTRDIVGGELAIELDRAREIGHPLVVLFAEPPAPEPHASSNSVCWPC